MKKFKLLVNIIFGYVSLGYAKNPYIEIPQKLKDKT